VKDSKDIVEYREFLESSQAPVFYQPWFLDAVSKGEKWSFVSHKVDGRVNAVWPYFRKSKYGQTYITQPPLTPYLGPYYQRSKQHVKNATWYSYQKKVLQGLWDQLPASILTTIHFPPEIENWQPLQWKDCKQTTRYTYRIDLLKSEEDIWSGLTDAQRNTIRKAEEQFEISNQADGEEVWNLIQKTYARQKTHVPFKRSIYEQVIIGASEHNYLEQIVIRKEGILCGFAFLIKDAKRTYLLLTAKSDLESGAVSLYIRRIRLQSGS